MTLALALACEFPSTVAHMLTGYREHHKGHLLPNTDPLREQSPIFGLPSKIAQSGQCSHLS